jgi:sarcosine oxidase
MSQRWDLIVIGAGAVGSAALRAAAEAGARVLGLEQHEPAHAGGSSHGHTRIFRHAYFEHADYVPLLRHSTARFESLERESGTPLLHRCGMLLLGTAGSELVDASLAAAARWGLPVEALDEPALAARFPLFNRSRGACAAFEADAGLLRPEQAVHAALRVAIARGVELRSGTRVTGLDEDRTGVTVHLMGDSLRGDAVIVAAGAWSAGLLPELAPLLRVTRQVQGWFEPLAQDGIAGLPCWLYDRGPGERAIYGLAPDPLADAVSNPLSRHPKAGLHGSTELVDPDRGARAVDAEDVHALRTVLGRVAPLLAGRAVHASTCLYTMSPDGHALLGTRRGSRRIHYAAGLSGHGFKLSPAFGDALVARALQTRSALPMDFLDPDRIAANAGR